MNSRRLGPILLALALAAPAAPVAYNVTISGIPNTPGTLIVALTDGGTPYNAVIIQNLVTTNVLLGGAVSNGVVSGSLPGAVILSDAAAFSDYELAIQPQAAGAVLSFYLGFTNNAPDAGSFPDGVAVYLLSASFNSLLPTNDPTGAQALLAIDGGAGTANRYNTVQVTATPTTFTPEPAVGAWACAGLLAVLSVRRRRSRLSAAAPMLALLALAFQPAAQAATVGNCIPKNQPGVCGIQLHSNFTWYAGVMTPHEPLVTMWAHPSRIQVHWGDGHVRDTGPGSFPAPNDRNPYKDPESGLRVLSNADQCYFELSTPCYVRARHVYANPGVYTVRIWLDIRGTPEAAPHDFTITVLPAPTNRTFSILSVGDSSASGEGAPSTATLWAGIPGYAAVHDVAEWETRFDGDEIAHRSYYSPASWMSLLLQNHFLFDFRVPLRVSFWDRSKSGATTFDIESQITNAPAFRSPSGKFDAIMLIAGANDVPLSGLIQYCYVHRCANGVNGLTDYVNSQGRTMTSVFLGLPDRYLALKTAIEGNPATRNARVFVGGYFNFNSSLQCFDPGGALFQMDPDEEASVDNLVKELNALIKNTAERFGWTFVPRVIPAGRTMCNGTSVNGPRMLNTEIDSIAVQGKDEIISTTFDVLSSIGSGFPPELAGTLHPNFAGHVAMGEAFFNAVLPTARAQSFCGSPNATGLRATAGPFRYDFLRRRFVQQVTVVNTTNADTQSQVAVRLDGLNPGVRLTRVGTASGAGFGDKCPASSANPASSYAYLGGALGPLQTFTMQLEFDNPGNAPMTWTPVVAWTK